MKNVSGRRRRAGAPAVAGRGRGGVFIVLGAVLLAAASAILLGVFLMERSANSADPDDPDAVLSKTEGEKDPDGFPKVDWNKWEKANPDIVGWVSVPGTRVSYPIVRAPEDDPDFYLRHDVHRRWNVYGAIYLDADSDAGLLDSDNSVVFGHHMNDGSMFAALAGYSNAEWAREHRRVLVQTRKHKVAYKMCSAAVVNGLTERKFTDFGSGDAFGTWRDAVYRASGTKVGKLAGDRVLTLVTCSYHRFGNERTLAYCMPVKVDGKKAEGAAVAEALGATPAEKADRKRAVVPDGTGDSDEENGRGDGELGGGGAGARQINLGEQAPAAGALE